jgi:hypothetical protein
MRAALETARQRRQVSIWPLPSVTLVAVAIGQRGDVRSEIFSTASVAKSLASHLHRHASWGLKDGVPCGRQEGEGEGTKLCVSVRF